MLEKPQSQSHHEGAGVAGHWIPDAPHWEHPKDHSQRWTEVVSAPSALRLVLTIFLRCIHPSAIQSATPGEQQDTALLPEGGNACCHTLSRSRDSISALCRHRAGPRHASTSLMDAESCLDALGGPREMEQSSRASYLSQGAL